MNGKDVTHFQTDDRGKTWKSKVSLDRLEILQNDVVHDLPSQSCILEGNAELSNKESQQRKNKSIRFLEVHKVK